jgi:hypothetical protein
MGTDTGTGTPTRLHLDLCCVMICLWLETIGDQRAVSVLKLT